MLLTFDDGYIDNYTFVLPILKQYGIQGSFFIPAKVIAEDVLLDVNKIHFILASANENSLLKDLNERMDYYRGKEFDFPSNKELFDKYAIANRFDCKEIIYIKRILQTILPEKLRHIISSELFEKYVGLPENKFARELYLNYDQVKFMKDQGMHIGIHGYDHYWMANLSRDELVSDIDRALNTMENVINRNAWTINYPYGNYDDNVISVAKEKGAILGVTTEVGTATLTKEKIFELPRFDCNDFPPKSDNYLQYNVDDK